MRSIHYLFVVAVSLLLGPASLPAASNEPVHTEAGLVSGVPARDPAITVYKGIPYAAPPVGDLRWKAPQPPVPWGGVHAADHFGNIPVQTQHGPAVPMGEDCLFLNIWTGATTPSEKRPVLVWIYGGRFIGGAGSEPNYDGEGLARKGLVVVTMNYRTGVFGFLATPELSEESGHHASGNYGLLDQVACLQWVRKNIAAFGGDPERVTIAGQSAGAGSVLMLCDSPLAKGLFQGGIAQSGARFPNDPELRGLPMSWRSLHDAEGQGVEYARAHGAASLKELRALTPEQLLVGNNANDDGVYGHPPRFRPTVDGWVLPHNYSQTLAKGAQNNVPILTGNNLDETGAGPQPRTTLDEFRMKTKGKYGALADEFLKFYPASSDQEAGTAQNAAARDNSRASLFLWATDWTQATKQKVFTYFWTHAPPSRERDRRGAYHGSEINYAFNNLYANNQSWTDEDRKIANTLSSYWANFAKCGDPNGHDLPAWIPVNPDAPMTMELGAKFVPMPVADPDKLAYIKRFYAIQEAW